MSISSTGKLYRPIGQVARRYGKSTRTIDRWLDDPRLKFPRPDLVINGRRHWTDETLDAFDRRLADARPGATDDETVSRPGA